MSRAPERIQSVVGTNMPVNDEFVPPTLTLVQWNDRLLQHHFLSGWRGGPASDENVVLIGLTGLDFCRAAADGDVVAFRRLLRNPDAVIDQFIDEIRRDVAAHRDSFDEALAGAISNPDEQGRDWAPRHGYRRPRFYAHLVASCLAYARPRGVTERSYPASLRELTGASQLGNLNSLRRAWEALAEWLGNAREEGRWRGLMLPEGGWANIGYSVRLAFPGRGDRSVLAEVLADLPRGTSRTPLLPALSRIGSVRARLSQEFRSELERFERTLRNGGIPDPASEIVWQAIVDSAGLAPAEGTTAEADPDWRLVRREDPFGEPELILVQGNPGATLPAPFTIEEWPLEHAEWRHFVQRQGDYLEAVRRVFASPRAFRGRLARFLASGVVLMVRADHGFFESTDGWDDQRDVAMLVSPFMRDRLELATGSRAVPLAGWFFFQAPNRPEPDALRDAGLFEQEFPFLFPSLSRPSIRLRGGVRLEGGFLGFHEHLPEIRIAADSVTLNSRDGQAISLATTDHRSWTLPSGDLSGEFEFRASGSGEIPSRTTSFIGSPAGIEFRVPATFDGWFEESCAIRMAGERTDWVNQPLDATRERDDRDDDHTELAGDTVRLGTVLGDFGLDVAEPAWVATPDAARPGHWLIAPTTQPVRMPLREKMSARRVRQYRRMLSRSRLAVHSEDLHLQKRAFADEVQRNVQRQQIPDPPAMERELLDSRSAVEPALGLPRLVDCLAARALNVTGIGAGELADEITAHIHADRALAWNLIRAWNENGWFDRRSRMNWSEIRYFAVRPHLILWRSCGTLFARLAGLVHSNLRTVATSIDVDGATCRVEPSSSPWLLPRITYVLGNESVARELSGVLGLAPSRWLRTTEELLIAPDMTPSLPPSGYRHLSSWDWVGGGFRVPASSPAARVSIELWDRGPSRPDWYLVKVGDEPVASTYSRNWAVLRGYREAGRSPFSAPTLRSLRRAFDAPVYLPLGMARLLAVTAPIEPSPAIAVRGTRRIVQYEYHFPTHGLHQQVLGLLGRHIGSENA